MPPVVGPKNEKKATKKAKAKAKKANKDDLEQALAELSVKCVYMPGSSMICVNVKQISRPEKCREFHIAIDILRVLLTIVSASTVRITFTSGRRGRNAQILRGQGGAGY